MITYENTVSALSFESKDVLDRLAEAIHEFGVDEDRSWS